MLVKSYFRMGFCLAQHRRLRERQSWKSNPFWGIYGTWHLARYVDFRRVLQHCKLEWPCLPDELGYISMQAALFDANERGSGCDMHLLGSAASASARIVSIGCENPARIAIKNNKSSKCAAMTVNVHHYSYRNWRAVFRQSNAAAKAERQVDPADIRPARKFTRSTRSMTRSAQFAPAPYLIRRIFAATVYSLLLMMSSFVPIFVVRAAVSCARALLKRHDKRRNTASANIFNLAGYACSELLVQLGRVRTHPFDWKRAVTRWREAVEAAAAQRTGLAGRMRAPHAVVAAHSFGDRSDAKVSNI
jgi:hypothetical protein